MNPNVDFYGKGSDMKEQSTWKVRYKDWLSRNEKPLRVARDIIVLGVSLALAYYASDILLNHTGVENNSALVFTLAVALVSFLTTGYVYGVIASVVGAFSPTTTSWPPMPCSL